MAQQGRNAQIRDIVRRYYGLWWVYSFAGGFLFGIYPLFLRARGLNQFEINSVLATYFAVTFVTDVPTGAFADALGRRRSFRLGCALRVAAFTLYFFSHSYPLFLLAETIDALGTTFGNGAIDAWGVDALDAAGFAGVKDRLFSRISQLSTLGFMAAAAIGAHVADIDIAWPWLLGAAGYLLSAVVGGLMMREDPRSATDLRPARMLSQVAGRVRDGMRLGFARRAVLMLSLAAAVQVGAWAPYWLEWPAYFTDSYGVGMWIVGWIYCLLALARLAGAELVIRYWPRALARPASLTALVAGASAMLFGAGLSGARAALVLGLLFIMNVCTGAMQPLMQSWFNEQIESAERATLISFESTFATLGGSLGLLLSGVVADAFGTALAWQMAGVLSLAAAPCYWSLRARGGAGTVAALAGGEAQ